MGSKKRRIILDFGSPVGYPSSNMSKIKLRTDPSANYRAVFIDGRTIRTPLDPAKPITELAFPEFYDVSFGTRCATGNCPWCYASALKSGVHYTRLAEKIERFFGPMGENRLPFQVACGGGGESLENPECEDALKAFNNLGVVPNITSNGVLINKRTLPLVLKYCMGLAITCHPHLESSWRRAIDLLSGNTRLNIHVIISDSTSVETFRRLYDEFASKIEYFVLLKHMNVGHAVNNPKTVDYDGLEAAVDPIYKEGKLAFGANFYSWLLKKQKKYGLSLYSPEIMSKYLLLDDNLGVYNNSFEMKPVPFAPGRGCELGHARSIFED